MNTAASVTDGAAFFPALLVVKTTVKGDKMIMLYPKSRETKLSSELFENPTREYRAAPFWAWNGKLADSTLDEQIEMLKTMGMGGFHMHVRTGMDSPYLNDEFMGHVEHCVKKAKKDDMLAWLYDEDRWPSGSAGGKVTGGHPEYAMRYLLFTTRPYGSGVPHGSDDGEFPHRNENGILYLVYDIELDEDGCLKSSRVIDEKAPAKGGKWYVYLEHAADDPWFNNRPYIDTMSAQGIREFICETHEAYAARLRQDFGGTVPAIFTDEPHLAAKTLLSFAREEKDVILPWTEGFDTLLTERAGENAVERLPEVIWQLPDGRVSELRYQYYDLLADRFSVAFSKQLGDWCETHGIHLTGHLYAEPTLLRQTDGVGDAMRNYPYFGLPGIDMLCDRHEYNTAKQVESIVHQDGKEGMLSELYGVTGWDYEFRGHKLQGDWQAALGVTVRVPHLTWMTMKGEAKRDYPACIGYQSPWWDQYRTVEDHFARLNTVMTRGRAVVRVAVVHPIESYWLNLGPEDQTGLIRRQMDEQFGALTETLLFGMIDFDFISEANFARQCPKAGNPLRVGEMSYDAVILCGSCNLRGTTLSRLEEFSRSGGRVIIIGDCPKYIDAKASDAAKTLYANAEKLSFDRSAILTALSPYRFIEAMTESGAKSDSLIYQLRQDNGCQWLFIANGKNPVSPDVSGGTAYRFILNGEYAVTEYNTLTGAIAPLPAELSGGKTVIKRVWHLHDSLLLKLEKAGTVVNRVAVVPENEQSDPVVLKYPVDITLREPNMYLLDMAEYALNGGEYQPEEEILRLGNLALVQLGLPKHHKRIEQPYIVKEELYRDRIRLRYRVLAEYEVKDARLALEDLTLAEIVWNGRKVENTPVGWYVDRDIRCIALPPINVGENVLEVTLPIGRRTTLEAMYLLGDFGVRVNGAEKVIIPPVRRLGFGDIVSQGLPFYTGNIDYRFSVETKDTLTVRTPYFRGALIKVIVDGVDRGNIAFAPYRLDVDGLAPGGHDVVLRLYGTRQNGFGQLHHLPTVYFYQSPDSWRSVGDLWTYEYQFKPMGILKSPELTV